MMSLSVAFLQHCPYSLPDQLRAHRYGVVSVPLGLQHFVLQFTCRSQLLEA